MQHVRSTAQLIRETTDALETTTASSESCCSRSSTSGLNLLLDVLAPDVTLWTDGGGKVQAAQRVIHGRDKVTRLLAMAGELFGVLVVDLSEQGDRLRAIYGVVNPDKLTMLAGPLRERP